MQQSSDHEMEDVACETCSRSRFEQGPSATFSAEVPGRYAVNSKLYTDSDLAAEMNRLSFQDRQALEEEIHGVADVVPETEEFVNAKLKEMRDLMELTPSKDRQAWERAVFLRPSLGQDRSVYLLFLRSRRFRVLEAARVMLKHFENKRKLFGDELLCHPITWNDLTEEERDIVKSGCYQLLLNRDRAGRGVSYARLCDWNVGTNHMAYARSFWYVDSTVQNYPEIQKRGIVIVADLRGAWKASPFQVLQFLMGIKDITENVAHHIASTHMLHNDSRLDAFIRANRAYQRQDHRLRYRIQYGSTLEITYDLRTYGVNVDDCLDDSPNGIAKLRLGVLAEIERRRALEEQWRQSQIPYQDPNSRTALYPNPADIVMGRKGATLTWPGNLTYHKVISQQAHRYINPDGMHKVEKTVIVMDTIQILEKHCNARFLIRNDNGWERAAYAEVQKKTSQALLKEAKRLSSA